jgi:hypothetical protein
VCSRSGACKLVTEVQEEHLEAGQQLHVAGTLDMTARRARAEVKQTRWGKMPRSLSLQATILFLCAAWTVDAHLDAVRPIAKSSMHYHVELLNIYKPRSQPLPISKEDGLFGSIPATNGSLNLETDDFEAVVVGDSFAECMAGAFNWIAKSAGTRFLMSARYSCFPIFSPAALFVSCSDDAACMLKNSCILKKRPQMLELATAVKSSRVVLAGNWPSTRHIFSGYVVRDGNETSELNPTNMILTIFRIVKSGRKVIVIGAVPGAGGFCCKEWRDFGRQRFVSNPNILEISKPVTFLSSTDYNVRECLQNASAASCSPTSRFREPVVRINGTNTSVMMNRSVMRDYFGKLMGSPQMLALRQQGCVSYVDPFESLCDIEKGHCFNMDENQQPLYSDDKHLTVRGSILLGPHILRAL